MPWRRSGRMWRHIVTDHTSLRRAVPVEVMRRLEAAIAAGEKRHRGQVCLAVEPALPLTRIWHKFPPRERALEVFGLMRVWDTEENSGVLLYLLLADHDIEIVADRGANDAVGHANWERICSAMERHFRKGEFVQGLETGIEAVNDVLAQHFPRSGEGPNELPDRPRIL